MHDSKCTIISNYFADFSKESTILFLYGGSEVNFLYVLRDGDSKNDI